MPAFRISFNTLMRIGYWVRVDAVRALPFSEDIRWRHDRGNLVLSQVIRLGVCGSLHATLKLFCPGRVERFTTRNTKLGYLSTVLARWRSVPPDPPATTMAGIIYLIRVVRATGSYRRINSRVLFSVQCVRPEPMKATTIHFPSGKLTRLNVIIGTKNIPDLITDLIAALPTRNINAHGVHNEHSAIRIFSWVARHVPLFDRIAVVGFVSAPVTGSPRTPEFRPALPPRIARTPTSYRTIAIAFALSILS